MNHYAWIESLTVEIESLTVEIESLTVEIESLTVMNRIAYC
jgi:hypothetical protein